MPSTVRCGGRRAVRRARTTIPPQMPRSRRPRSARWTLHREFETLLREPIVLASIEAIEPGGPVPHALLDLVGLDEQIHREDLLPEVPLVETGAEDDLVEPLQLGQRKARRQELEANRRVAHLAAQALVR